MEAPCLNPTENIQKLPEAMGSVEEASSKEETSSQIRRGGHEQRGHCCPREPLGQAWAAPMTRSSCFQETHRHLWMLSSASSDLGLCPSVAPRVTHG